MLCQECNKDKETRERFKKHNSCGCCNGVRRITWHRYLQYQFGWIFLYQSNGEQYEYWLLETYEKLCEKWNKKGRIQFKSFNHINGNWEDERGFNQNHKILIHYCNQLRGKDCLIK